MCIDWIGISEHAFMSFLDEKITSTSVSAQKIWEALMHYIAAEMKEFLKVT